MKITELMQSPSNDIFVGDIFMIELGDVLVETPVLSLSENGIELKCDTVFENLLNKNFKLEVINEAEYQGRKVKLGKPFFTPDGPKKRSVYVKNDKGNVVKVNFGDKKLRIKKSNPKRRKSFRARHKCASPGPKWKARYWSCRFW